MADPVQVKRDPEELAAEVVALERELGATGVVVVRGDIYNTADYVPELRGDQAMSWYEEMRSSDGQLDACLYRVRAPIESGQWVVKPPTSGRDALGNPEPTDDDRKLAEWLSKRTVEGDPMNDGSGWSGFVDESLEALVFGFALFECVWGTDSQGFQVIAKMAPRLQHTVRWFHVDDERGELDSIRQDAYKGNRLIQVDIPADKSFLWSLRKRGNNYWGRSAMRSCYFAWSIWRQLAVIDAMRHERHGMGIPVLKVGPAAGPNANEAAKKVVKELRAHERQYVKLPPGFELDWLFPSGQGSDILGSMRYWDEIKARALFTEVMNIASASTAGNRNTGEVKTRAMMGACTGIASRFSSQYKRQCSSKMIRQNFGDKAPVPEVALENLDAIAVEELATMLKTYRDADIIIPDTPLEVYIRKSLKLPPAQESSAREKAAPPVAGGGGFGGEEGDGDQDPKGGSPSAGGGDKGEGDKKPKPAARRRAESAARAPRKIHPHAHNQKYRVATSYGGTEFGRSPFEHEVYCAFQEMATYFDTQPELVYKEAVAPVRAEQIAKIAKLATYATDKARAKRDIPRPLTGRLAENVFGVLKESALAGRTSVRDELRRQRAGRPVGRPMPTAYPTPMAAALSDIVTMSVKQVAKLRRQAELFAEAETEMLIGRAVEVAAQAMLADIAKEEIEKRVLRALEELSVPSVMSRLEGAIIGSYTRGRNDAMGSIESEIETTFYSAIMDAATCEPCAELDGTEHAYGDTDFITPNPNCDWPPHCRCVTVPIFKREPSEAFRARYRHLEANYDPDQPRAEDGKWTDGGGGGGGAGTATDDSGGGAGAEDVVRAPHGPNKPSHITPEKREKERATIEKHVKDPAVREEIFAAQEAAAAMPSTHEINTPERLELRESVAERAYGEGAAVKEREAWIVSGLPASGKNTAVSEPLMREHGAMLIDSDEVKQMLPEYGTGIGAGAVHEESSSIIVPAVLGRAVANGDNIVMPRVGKSYDSLKSDVEGLKAAGYKVHMVYVHVDDNVAAERAVGRFQRTGRMVSLSYIESVDGHPRRTFDKIKLDGIADSYSMYDNNGPKGSKAKRIE